MSYAEENYGGKQGYGNDSENGTGDGLDSLRNKYGSDRTSAQRTASQQDPSQQSVYDRTGGKGSDYSQSTNNQDKAYAQAKMTADFGRQAKSDANAAARESGKNSLDLAGQRDDQNAKAEYTSRRLIENIDKSKIKVDNDFKASESKLDRDKSSDEFTQNRAQSKFDQAQSRANLEYNTAQGLAKDRQGQDAELARLRASGDVASALADKSNAAQLARLRADGEESRRSAGVSNAANLNLANITSATERAGQASAVDQARLAANAQVKAALFAPRQYSGY